MKWYFVAGDRPSIDMLVEEGVKSILVSYAYFKKGLPDNLLKAAKNPNFNLLLDSGAYTNLSKPGTVELPAYVDFVKSYKDVLTEYIVLDDPKKREVTIQNFATMLKAGLNPMVVDHVWFEWASNISKVYASGRKVCWGGLISRPDGPMGDWASRVTQKGKHMNYTQSRQVWLNICRRLAERHKKAVEGKKTKVHLLAAGPRITRMLPFFDIVDSFDATTWALASGLGWVLDCVDDGPGRPPRIKRIHETKLPPEIKAKHKGIDPSTWSGRRVIAIRELLKFCTKLETFHAHESKKGFKHLWDIVLGDAETEEKEKAGVKKKEIFAIPADPTVFASRELWDAGVLNEAVVEKLESGNRSTTLGADLATALEAVISEMDEEAQEKADEVDKQVPDRSASTEDKRKAQQARSQEYGIEALDGKGERLTFPAGYPRDLKLYGDPVNLMFPLDPAGRARNARARFKQFADDIYDKDQSKKIVHTRIVKRLLALGSKPSFDENDPLDRMLPADIRDKLEKATVDVEVDEDVDDVAKIALLPVDKKAEEMDDRHIVFGVVLEPNSVDTQGDTIKEEEIERAAHLWLARFQDRGLMHRRIVNSKIEIYESYIAPTNLTIGGQRVTKGTWLLMYHVLDEALWKDIKSGKITGFSMGGFARRVRL